jgi:hypothetical protein
MAKVDIDALVDLAFAVESGDPIDWGIFRQTQEQIMKMIADSVIENFDISSLQLLTKNYGEEAMKNALANLDAWHNQYFW